MLKIQKFFYLFKAVILSAFLLSGCDKKEKKQEENAAITQGEIDENDELSLRNPFSQAGNMKKMSEEKMKKDLEDSDFEKK